MKWVPGFRTTLGIAACGIYYWRVQDPKGSYAIFYDATDWLTRNVTSLFVADGAITNFLRNAINLVLVDQVEGFLIGVAFVTLIAAILWPLKAGGKLAVKGAKKVLRPKQQEFVYPAVPPMPEPPLLRTQITRRPPPSV